MRYVLFLLISFFTNQLLFGHKIVVQKDTLVKNKKQCLELKGIVKQTKRIDKIGESPLANAAIKVFDENKKIIAQYATNKKGQCDLKLPLDKKFILEFSKEGYVSKFLELDTKVPPEKKMIYSFPFDISIFKEIKDIDLSVLKKPIAKIHFIYEENNFGYDLSNTDEINTALKKMYQDYYLLKKVDADFDSIEK